MALTTTTLGDILKEVYSGAEIEEQQHVSRPFLSMLPDAPETLGGDSFRFAVNVESDQGFAFVDESSPIPASSNENVQQAVLQPKVLLAQIESTGLAKARSGGGEMAFADAIIYHGDRKLQRIFTYLEGALFRDATGLLARVNEPSAVPDTTGGDLDLDNGGATFLRAGMNIDFFHPTNVTKQATAKITEVELFNDQISTDVDVSSSIADNSRLFLSGTQTSGASSIASREIQGLSELIKTSGNWNNLALSSYPTLKGNVIDFSSNDLTEDVLQRGLSQIMLRGGVDMTTESYRMVVHPSQRRKYLDLVVPQHQFTGMSADTSYTELSWNGWNMIVTEQAFQDEVYLINPMDFQRFLTPDGPLHIVSEYNGSPFIAKTGFDSFYILLRGYMEYSVRRPSAACRIENLATPAL